MKKKLIPALCCIVLAATALSCKQNQTKKQDTQDPGTEQAAPVQDSLQAVQKEQKTMDKIAKLAEDVISGGGSVAEKIVGALVDDRFVDDSRYASAFAREKASLQGWGPVKIRFQLRSKGIQEAVIDGALGEIDPARAASRLERLLQNKWHSLRDDPQGRLKLIKFALGRGYEYSDIEPLVKRITASGEADDGGNC